MIKFNTDPFFYSIFLKQFYRYFIRAGKYAKVFVYFFLLNKLLKKKDLNIFEAICYVISEYFIEHTSIKTKSRKRKRKKKAKKFKRKRKKNFKNWKKLFYLKLLYLPQKKLFKTIRKFYSCFLIKKNFFFLTQLYNSYINFFLIDVKSNPMNIKYLNRKYLLFNIFTNTRWKWRLKKKVKKRFKLKTKKNLDFLKSTKFLAKSNSLKKKKS